MNTEYETDKDMFDASNDMNREKLVEYVDHLEYERNMVMLEVQELREILDDYGIPQPPSPRMR